MHAASEIGEDGGGAASERAGGVGGGAEPHAATKASQIRIERAMLLVVVGFGKCAPAAAGRGGGEDVGADGARTNPDFRREGARSQRDAEDPEDPEDFCAGTRCAVAHLVEATGGHALVDRIARSTNNAFVRELGGDAEIGAWAARAGFTLQELGRIQPSYCDTAADMCFCRYRPAAPAGIDGTVVAMNEHATIRIDAVYGDASVATVGSEIVIGDADVFAVGDKVVAGVDSTSAIYQVHRVVDGMVDSSCGSDLSKEDGLAAIMAEGGCTEYLVALDEAWGDEECSSVNGCSTSGAAPLGVQPLLLGVCAVAVGVWAQRRRLRRQRKARARAQARRAEGYPPARDLELLAEAAARGGGLARPTRARALRVSPPP